MVRILFAVCVDDHMGQSTLTTICDPGKTLNINPVSLMDFIAFKTTLSFKLKTLKLHAFKTVLNFLVWLSQANIKVNLLLTGLQYTGASQ